MEKCIQSRLIQTEYTARIGEYKPLFGHDSVTIRLDCIQSGPTSAPSPPGPVLHPETVIVPVSTRLDRKNHSGGFCGRRPSGMTDSTLTDPDTGERRLETVSYTHLTLPTTSQV